MEKFRDVVMKLSENAGPELKSIIQEHLANFISDFHTPDHPPYAAMIHRAIEELNEKRGSSEESISEYIKKHHTDLPLAHTSLLKHHLGKLCDSGEIVVTGKHLYLLPGTNPKLESCVRTGKDKIARKKRKRKGRGRVGKKDLEVFDNHEEAHDEVEGETDRCNKEKEELIGEYNEMRVDYNVDRVGELNEVVKQAEQENGMLDERSPLCQQLSHAICTPVVESNQPEPSSLDRPPGFEFVKFRSVQTDLIEQEPEMVFNSERLSESETLQQVDPEEWRQGQVKCKLQRLSECPKSASSNISTELLPLQHQQQLDPSNPEGLQGGKLIAVKPVELYPIKLKQYGRRKKLKSQTKEKEMQDVTAELEQIVQTKQLDLSDLDKSSQSFTAECQEQFEYCEEKQIPEYVFCGQKQLPESKKQVTINYDVDRDTKQQHIVEHDKSDSESPIEQQVTIKTGQVVRRSQRLAKSKQTCTSDLLPSSQLQFHHLEQLELQNDHSSTQVEEFPQLNMEMDSVNLVQKLQQLHLPAKDRVQTITQTVTSSELSPALVQMDKKTKLLQQRSKLRSWQKWSTSQENSTTGRLTSLALGRLEQVQQETLCSEFNEQPGALKELPKQQQAQGNMCGKTELEAATSTMELPQVYRGQGRPPKHLSQLHHHQHEKSQQQTQGNMCGKTELEAATSTMELPQVYRGRGRPPKHLSPLHHQHKKSQPPMYVGQRRGRGRPPKMKLGQGSMQTA